MPWRPWSAPRSCGAWTDCPLMRWLPGECRLTLSVGNLLLSRYNGYRLIIDDMPRIIPADGVTLAPTGLTANTIYYIYAAMSGGNMVLEASTTGHTQDPRNGVEVKLGDASRTLVGMARPIAGPAWADSVTQRFVISWYNRRALRLEKSFSGSRSTSSSSWVELGSEIRVECLQWEQIDIWCDAMAQNSTVGQTVNTAVFDDTGNFECSTSAHSPVANYQVAESCHGLGPTNEGYHYFTVKCSVSGGTGTWVSTTVLRAIFWG